MQNARVLIPVGLFVAFSLAHYAGTQLDKSEVEVLVASRDLVEGEFLKTGMFRVTKVYVTENDPAWLRPIVKNLEEGEVLNYELSSNIEEGHFITLDHFRETRPELAELRENEVGLQVKLSVDFIGHFWVGSKIGFLINDISEDGETMTTTVLQDFRVVAIGEYTDAERGDSVGKGHDEKIITVAAKLSPGPDGKMMLQENERRLVQANSTGNIVSLVILGGQGA